jgi:hypothetical protein
MKPYQISILPEQAILEEIIDNFNQEAFEDDVFQVADQITTYFFYRDEFHRTIKSPFFVGDIIQSGTLSEKKKHKKVGPLRVFCLQKDVIFVDHWSLQYDYQKKVEHLAFQLYGDYKFFIESPSTFLKTFSTFWGPLASIHLLDFSSKFNQWIQHDIVSTLLQTSLTKPEDLSSFEQALMVKVQQRFLRLGIKITTMTVNIFKI